LKKEVKIFSCGENMDEHRAVEPQPEETAESASSNRAVSEGLLLAQPVESSPGAGRFDERVTRSRDRWRRRHVRPSIASQEVRPELQGEIRISDRPGEQNLRGRLLADGKRGDR